MTVEEAVNDLKNGNFVIIIDDEKRENEGDLVISAEKVTEEKLNFMLKSARGILCVPMEAKRLGELKIPLMVINHNDRFNTPFTVSVDHCSTSTGVSVKDRIKTIKALINPACSPEELLRPGHMFPLKAHELGLQGRKGHTEAAIGLMKLASLYPAALIAEIMDDSGKMADLSYLGDFSKRHGIRLLSVNDLCSYLKKKG
ncbi:MAG TPA: 3,4-dihydroxy-2-butanone-4-phosphate synthase [Candidatus Nanoarchaeia archaeon]|nr:3,4-dihydroxy-2-butanone-4-phosphate synthase [Candidatus Nanoarchaeia archaeon]